MFKKKSEDQLLAEAHAKAAKRDPEAADAALKATTDMQRGKDIARKASSDALEGLIDTLMLDMMKGGKEGKIKILTKNALALGAMQALTEVIMPEIYNDMYKKFEKMGMNDIETDLVANIFLSNTLRNLVKGLDDAA